MGCVEYNNLIVLPISAMACVCLFVFIRKLIIAILISVLSYLKTDTYLLFILYSSGKVKSLVHIYTIKLKLSLFHIQKSSSSDRKGAVCHKYVLFTFMLN